jgi:putative spermidine/putrescine transport system ATP-binding protein
MNVQQTGASLHLERLTKMFGSFSAVEGVELTVEPGEFISFLGPSGSGKTTTLNMIAGFEEPSAGSIHIDGRDVTTIPIHRRNIGMVFQGYALFPHMTVEKNIEYPLKNHGYSKAERRIAIDNALAKVSLKDFRDRMPNQLSGGQKQRVALARAIAYEPPLLLMDEPLSALDKGLREGLQGEIRRIHRELGTTVVYVTHDQDEALALSDRIVVFEQGQVQQIGPPSELYANPANQFVSGFLGESIRLSGEVNDIDGRGEFVSDDVALTVDSQVRGPAQLIVRPESVIIDTNSDNETLGCTAVWGEIVDRVYVGHSVKFNVRCASGGGAVRMSSRVAPDLDIGSRVRLAWSDKEARILASYNDNLPAN